MTDQELIRNKSQGQLVCHEVVSIYPTNHPSVRLHGVVAGHQGQKQCRHISRLSSFKTRLTF